MEVTVGYTDFDLELVETELGVAQRLRSIFPDLPEVAGPAWLEGYLARGMALVPMSEKARSEFIVAPILLAVRELTGKQVAILSGLRLDVDDLRKLAGECGFLLPARRDGAAYRPILPLPQPRGVDPGDLAGDRRLPSRRVTGSARPPLAGWHWGG